MAPDNQRGCSADPARLASNATYGDMGRLGPADPARGVGATSQADERPKEVRDDGGCSIDADSSKGALFRGGHKRVAHDPLR